MGELVAYPVVPPEKIIEIYEQSRREPIRGFGFFIELMSAYDKEYPLESNDPLGPGDKNASRWMENFQKRLVAAGLHSSYIADYRTPPRYRIGDYCEDGWLVILGTGFNRQLHTPLADGLVERVQEIIGTSKKPRWFTMKRFSYPNPKAWNACVVYKPPPERMEEPVKA